MLFHVQNVRRALRILRDLRRQALQRQPRVLARVRAQHAHQVQRARRGQRGLGKVLPRLHHREIAGRQQIPVQIVQRAPGQQVQLRPRGLDHQPPRRARGIQKLAQFLAQRGQALVQAQPVLLDRLRPAVPVLTAIDITLPHLPHERPPLLIVQRRPEVLRRDRPAAATQEHAEDPLPGQRQRTLRRAARQHKLHDHRATKACHRPTLLRTRRYHKPSFRPSLAGARLPKQADTAHATHRAPHSCNLLLTPGPGNILP